MKRYKIWIPLASLVLICIITGFVLIQCSTPKVGSFDVQDYQDEIERFPSDAYVGEVSDSASAVKHAEDIWKDTYGTSSVWNKPYQVFHDSENGVWLIQGNTWLPLINGGEPHILIRQSDGKVLAVWHTK